MRPREKGWFREQVKLGNSPKETGEVSKLSVEGVWKQSCTGLVSKETLVSKSLGNLLSSCTLGASRTAMWLGLLSPTV